jgi:Rrf2 family protein
MLSSKAKYAVRAALMLAERIEDDSWTSAYEIAERESIPRKFLEAILVLLRDAGFVESRRGPSGGHRLGVSPAELTIADIIRLIDGPLALTPCASRTQFRACDDCVDIRTCRLRHVMQRARDAAAGVLDSCSLAELVQAPKHQVTFPSRVRRNGSRPRL